MNKLNESNNKPVKSKENYLNLAVSKVTKNHFMSMQSP